MSQPNTDRWEPDSSAVLHLVTGPGSPGSGALRTWVAVCGIVVTVRDRGYSCPVCSSIARQGEHR